jgi:peptidoglycan/LPS O-acetylase OafA/YrhL
MRSSPRHVDITQDTATTPTLPKRFPLPQLDTIRVLAMLSIFLHHLWKTVITNPEGIYQKILDPLFSTASDGVILFNVISGFLLAMPHLGPEQRPPMGYGDFLRKRFLRIIPAYYLALLVFTLVNVLHFSYPLGPACDMLLQHLLFVNSLNYSNMLTNFSPFWYLGPLAQFYLLFPLLLSLFMRIGPTSAVLLVSSLCWGGWIFLAWLFPESSGGGFPDFSENLMHFNLPGRLPEFAIGMWLASLWQPCAGPSCRGIFNGPFSLFTTGLGLYLVVGTVFLSNMNLPFTHIYHVALGLMVFHFLLTWEPVAREGESPVVKDMAEHSYSLYIVHHPLFSYAGVMPSTVVHTIGNFGFLTLWLLPLCYLAARILDLVSTFIVKKLSVRVSFMTVR